MYFTVTAVDSIEPVISNCPQPVTETVPLGATSGIVTWVEPIGTDNSGTTPTLFKSHEPGSSFPVGNTQVTYIFTDGAGNDATCSFSVIGNYDL